MILIIIEFLLRLNHATLSVECNFNEFCGAKIRDFNGTTNFFEGYFFFCLFFYNFAHENIQ